MHGGGDEFWHSHFNLYCVALAIALTVLMNEKSIAME